VLRVRLLGGFDLRSDGGTARFLAALDRLAGQLAGRGDHTAAIGHAERLVHAGRSTSRRTDC
jgi:hypothetical protein